MIKAAWGGISNWVGGIWNSATEKLNIGWEIVKQAFITYNPWSMIKAAWGGISDWIGGIWNSVTEKLNIGWELIKQVLFSYNPLTIITEKWGGISDWIGNTWDSVKTKTSDAWESIKDYVSGGIGKMLDKINDFNPIEGITSAFKEVTTYLSSLPTVLIKMGKQAVDGFFKGFAKIAKFKDKVVSWFGFGDESEEESKEKSVEPVAKGLEKGFSGRKRGVIQPKGRMGNTGLALQPSANDSFRRLSQPNLAVVDSNATLTATPALASVHSLATLDTSAVNKPTPTVNNNQQYEIIVNARSNDPEAVAQQVRQALHEHEAEKEFRLRTAAYDHQGGYA